MKNLSIGIKLTLGFGIILVLLLVSGGVGYHYLSQNLESFMEYRGLARDTNLMGHVQADMLMVRMNMKNFLITDSPQDLDGYKKYMQSTQTFMAEASKEIQDPERVPLVQNANTLLQDYNKQFQQVVAIQKQREEADTVMLSNGPLLEQTITSIMRSAKHDEDADAAYYAGTALRSLLLSRMQVVNFLQSHKLDTAKEAQKNFDIFTKDLKQLDQELQNPQRRQLLGKINELKSDYLDALNKTIELVIKRNSIVTEKLDKWGPAMASNLEDAKLSVKKDQDELGPQVQQQSEFAKTLVGGISLAAVILGLFAGIVITRAISGPLAKATNFANLVAQGDFDHEININQKDEVGKICDALVHIKDAVKQTVDQCEQIVDDVERGIG